MFKTFDPARDVISTLSPINEVIVMGSTLFSQSANNNVKRTNHWTSASVSGSYYDAAFSDNILSASSLELIDITYGQSISSSYYLSASAVNKTEKSKIYRLFAKRLLGSENKRFSISGSMRDELVFLSLRRTQTKDEIKKGTVSIVSVFSGSAYNSQGFNSASITDVGAPNTFQQDIAGDYASLFSGSRAVGLMYYQAGIAILVPELWSNTSSITTNLGNFWSGSTAAGAGGGFDYNSLVLTASYNKINDAITNRLINITFINQSNLHSTLYFCRLQNDEFNYSSNPTFVDSSGRIIPTSSSVNLVTRTYPTKVGLLGENGEILAVACFSQPILKSPENEFSIKVRLDY